MLQSGARCPCIAIAAQAAPTSRRALELLVRSPDGMTEAMLRAILCSR